MKLVEELKIIAAANGEPGILYESSLSRIKEHIENHDTGFITAHRREIRHLDGRVEKPTYKQNKSRNLRLRAELGQKYVVTKIRGIYIENYKSTDPEKPEYEVREGSFFVVDINDLGDLELELRRLGKKWNQDSIMFVPKGGKNGYLWGTGNAWPLLDQVEKFKNPVFGERGEFMSKVRGRPFIFPEIKEEDINPIVIGEYLPDYQRSVMGEMGRRAFINSDWRKG